MYRQIISYAALFLLTCQLLSGCGGEQYSYVPDHEIKPGPGLISGKNGGFTLLGLSEPEKNNSKGIDSSAIKKP